MDGTLQPDLTLLFDGPTEVSMARLAATRTPDKFERKSAKFFDNLREAFSWSDITKRHSHHESYYLFPDARCFYAGLPD